MEVGLFGENERPEAGLAFQLVEKLITDYWADVAAGRQRVYHADVLSDPGAELALLEHPCADFPS